MTIHQLTLHCQEISSQVQHPSVRPTHLLPWHHVTLSDSQGQICIKEIAATVLKEIAQELFQYCLNQ